MAIFGRTTHAFTVSQEIPPHIHPSTVVAALRDHPSIIRHQALVTDHRPISLPHPSYPTIPDSATVLQDDLYVSHPPNLPTPLCPYEITEVITIIPGVGNWAKKTLNFVTIFQDTEAGSKARAVAPGGVVVRSNFKVEQNWEGYNQYGWRLSEDVSAECATLLMPFVSGQLEKAHREIVAKILAQVEEQERKSSLRQPDVQAKPLPVAPKEYGEVYGPSEQESKFPTRHQEYH
jgi:hypothetical protein